MSKSKLPQIDPNRPLAAQALMNVETGEEIAGAWVTPAIPGIGFYKLLAKKKKDGTCEWVHFVQRADGSKDSVYRGAVENQNRLTDVVDAINRALNTAYGPIIRLQSADYDVYSLNGKKASGTVH
jgi:hypothetical protein